MLSLSQLLHVFLIYVLCSRQQKNGRKAHFFISSKKTIQTIYYFHIFFTLLQESLRIFPSVKSLGRNLLNPIIYSIFAMLMKNTFSVLVGFHFHFIWTSLLTFALTSPETSRENNWLIWKVYMESCRPRLSWLSGLTSCRIYIRALHPHILNELPHTFKRPCSSDLKIIDNRRFGQKNPRLQSRTQPGLTPWKVLVLQRWRSPVSLETCNHSQKQVRKSFLNVYLAAFPRQLETQNSTLCICLNQHLVFTHFVNCQNVNS